LWRYPAYVNLLKNMVSPGVSYPPVYGVEYYSYSRLGIRDLGSGLLRN
jgi:hypothetical protein